MSFTRKTCASVNASIVHMGQLHCIPLYTLLAYWRKLLVAERFIEDLVPEQRGIKDDVLRALLRAGTTAASTIVAAVIVRRVAKAFG